MEIQELKDKLKPRKFDIVFLSYVFGSSLLWFAVSFVVSNNIIRILLWLMLLVSWSIALKKCSDMSRIARINGMGDINE